MNIIIRKWGHSLGIRIPSLIVKEFNLKDGSNLEMIEEDGKLIFIPKKDALEILLNNINDENIHKEISTGTPAGKEIW